MTNIDMIRAEQVRIREAEMAKTWAKNCGVTEKAPSEYEQLLFKVADLAKLLTASERLVFTANARAEWARRELVGVRNERDMLARRVSDLVAQLAEANKYINDRIEMDAEDEPQGDVFSAIAVHQAQGVR